MTRMLKYLQVLGCLYLVFALTACTDSGPTPADLAPRASADQPLNVLFILTDDQAPYTVHANGDQQISTPAMDKLAEEGMSFTYVFNQGSWSGAVCAPSRRMINTGRHLYHTGMDPRKDQQQDYPAFGESFRSAGYDTFQTGKWHLPMDVWERSFTHGKAVFKGSNTLIDGIYFYYTPTHYFEFLVEDQHFSLETSAPDFTNSMKIKDSKINEGFYRLQKFTGEMKQTNKLLREEYDSTRNEAEKERIKGALTQLNIEVAGFQNELKEEYAGTFFAGTGSQNRWPFLPFFCHSFEKLIQIITYLHQ